MKLIIAIIKPSKLDAVRDALAELGITGMTVTEVMGFGRQKGHVEHYRGAEYVVEFRKKCKLEIAITAEQVDDAVNLIQKIACTDSVGDGKIFVLPLERVLRIRTGETDNEAL